MTRHIHEDNILKDILDLEGDDAEGYISYQLELAKTGSISIIKGGDFEAKYVIKNDGEILYSCGKGDSPDKAQKKGFKITL